ncbi:MAG TPA: hypothetical protein VJL32_02245 [Candidatus Paceibacterota bacterium]
MKATKKYLLLSMVTVLTVTGMSIGTFGLAQTVTPLVCSVGVSSVRANQAEILSATGGNGVYFWSGPNLNITNTAGNQFAVSYPTPGTYLVTVASAGQTATCSVVVTPAASTGSIACSPAVQNVTLGQTISVSATGGDGAYVWASPDLTIINPNGSGFSANYASSGLKTLTVTSAGLTDTCAVNVLSSVVTPPVTPDLPNTGGGFGQ